MPTISNTLHFGAFYRIVKFYPEEEGKKRYQESKESEQRYRDDERSDIEAEDLKQFQSLEPLKAALRAKAIPFDIHMDGTLLDSEEQRVSKEWFVVATTEEDVRRTQRRRELDEYMFSDEFQRSEEFRNNVIAEFNELGEEIGRRTNGEVALADYDPLELRDEEVLQALGQNRFDIVEGQYIQ